MSWTQQRIRRTFLDYFVEHKELAHREVASSPIIPRDDPTLLFTNAGMNQFKATLLGQETRDYNRACSVQKCVRAGGKHNDLDAVGKDGRHLTWFEMLGNWSFGDYYKEKAIEMAWDLTVNVYGLDPERVHVSIYKDDDESFDIWTGMGYPAERIVRLGDVENGDEENFWSMGDTGPCGPCTELYYDLGPEAGTGPEDYLGGEGDRYMEFWNNVFMDSDRSADGSTKPLAFQSVDTGMGMERIALILQGKLSVYETDLFQPIIRETAGLSGADWGHPDQRVDLQVIADHIRTLSFVISEGGQFSNEGRGYVLRRILRRAVRHGRRLGFDGPFLWRLVPTVASVFEGVYELPPLILQNTADALKEEEARFFRTIDRGMGRIHAILQTKAPDEVITGREAFELYDTYGFPVDLTRIEAWEHGYAVDEAGFETEMEAQRTRSREAGAFKGDGGEWTLLDDRNSDGFAGYGLGELETRVLRWRRSEDGYEVVLRATPFYAESGGEVADHGTLKADGFTLRVTDVQKINGIAHHYGEGEGDPAGLSGPVRAVVDVARRRRKTIHHTATHLMHAALKTVLGPHVEQKGSVVDPDRTRFDFSHGHALTAEQVAAIEDWVNDRIRRNEAVVKTEDVPIDEARAEGVTALFGEKYGDLVRTVRAGSDSFELCGGNHVDRTGDIGHFRIVGQSNVAAGVRRVEAVVGHAADAWMQRDRGLLDEAAQALKTTPERLPERLEALQGEVRELKRALEKARKSGGAVDADALIESGVEVEGALIVAARVEVDARETLAALVDRIRDKRPDAVVVLGAELDEKAAIIAAVGPRRKGRFHAGNLVRAVAERVGGRGGGRADFAQGGGTEPAKLAGALAQVPTLVAR